MKNPSSISYIDIHCHKIKLEKSVFSLPSLFVSELSMDVELDDAVSVGLHPWNINEKELVEHLSVLQAVAKNENVLAIGECGLDRNVSVLIDKQIEIFERQVQIANEENKAVIIHNVKAFSDFMQLLKSGINKTPWIFHGYNGNRIITKKLLEHDVYFSFGQSIMHNKSKARESISQIPLNRIFFETDDNDVSIKDIYNTASEILNIEITELKNTVYQTFLDLFVKNA